MGEDQPAEVDVSASIRSTLVRVQGMPLRPSEIYRKPADEPARTNRWQDRALIVVFLISIALPLTAMICRVDSTFVLEENRTLASRPQLALSLQSLGEFPAKFEAYFNDQFGFRRRLIHWQNFIKVAALGVSPSAKVVLGRDDWLYCRDLELDCYRAIKPFRPKVLEQWRRQLESRRDWLAARSIPYLVVIAPNKSTIYPEHMLAVYNKVEPRSRLDQLVEHLKARSSVVVVDLREPLFAEKSKHEVFHRTDSHWNNRGAYVGYMAIIEALAQWFPDLKATPRSEFPEVEFHERGMDLALIMAMRDYFKYKETFLDMKITGPKLAHQVHESPNPNDPPLKPGRNGENFVYVQPNPKLPRAVMFRDSFCIGMMPLLSDHFRRIVYCWQYVFDYELVERERPDVVIQELVERVIMEDSLPNNP
jgi:alginate O-acetyltransferase complex protein AlgJ